MEQDNRSNYLSSIAKTLIIGLLLISFSTTSATDIKFKKFRMARYWMTGYGVNVSLSFSNVWLNAAVRGTVTVKDQSLATVFQEVVTTNSIPAGTDGTLTTTGAFNPTATGEYTVSVHLEPVGMADIDPTNNDGTQAITVFDPPPGTVLFPGQGIDVSQLDFTFTGASQNNSSYGLISMDFMHISSISGLFSGWFNVSTATEWIVQNMPFDFSNGLTGLSTMFNLNTTADVTEIELFTHISQTPLLTFPTTPASIYSVGSVDYNAQGRDMPIGNIPAPIPFETIPFVEGGKNDLVWQHNHVSIEQDENQCAPASVANSLQWLENTKDINVPDDHQPGIRDNSLVGELDKTMQRQPHDPTSDNNIINGKVKYVDENGLNDQLSLKHKNRVGQSFIPNADVTVGSTTSSANTDNAVSLVDWIIEELRHGEDVELIIGWDGGGGHVVDLIGGGYVDGVPWLAWVHDANQGYDDNGTPANTADDVVKVNGGLTPQQGGYGWSYIIGERLASVVGGKTSKGTIDFALSESKKDPVSIDNNNKSLPQRFALSYNYPNPFNPSTTITYSLPVKTFVELKVFSVIGEEIKVIVNETQNPGTYKVVFNAFGLSSGVYFYTLRTGTLVQTRKMVLLK